MSTKKHSIAQKHFVRTAKSFFITNYNDSSKEHSPCFPDLTRSPLGPGMMGLLPPWKLLEQVKGSSLQPGLPKQWYTLRNCPHRELLAQLDYSCSSLRVQGNPPALAIPWMMGLETRVWGLSLQLHRRED